MVEPVDRERKRVSSEHGDAHGQRNVHEPCARQMNDDREGAMKSERSWWGKGKPVSQRKSPGHEGHVHGPTCQIDTHRPETALNLV